jgi:hypothetical protein
MNIDKNVLVVAVLACSVAAAALVGGMFHSETFSFEPKNVEAWVDQGLLQEFSRLVESGDRLHIKHVKVTTPDGLVFTLALDGRWENDPAMIDMTVSTSVTYDEVYDALVLNVVGRPQCAVREGGTTVSRSDTSEKICTALTEAVREALYRTPIRIAAETRPGQPIHVSVRARVESGRLQVSLNFLRFLWWMWLCVAVFPATLIYVVRRAQTFPGHHSVPHGRR